MIVIEQLTKLISPFSGSWPGSPSLCLWATPQAMPKMSGEYKNLPNITETGERSYKPVP